MNTFWNWVLGEDITREGTPELQWVGMPESWGVFVLILIVALIAAFTYWIYTREIDTCPKPLKIILGTMRFLVLMFLVVLMLKPSVVFKQVNTIKPIVAVMRDSSMSFTQKDHYTNPEVAQKLAEATGYNVDSLKNGGVSRAELLQAALTKDENKVLDQLRTKGTLRITDFSEVVSTSGTLSAIDEKKQAAAAGTEENSQAVELPLLIANGRGTDMSQGLRELLSNPGRLSAIVLASDGQHNGSNDPIELAYKAKDLGIPIFTIGVGDASRPRNLSINKIYARKTVPVNEPFEIKAPFYIEDFDGGSAQVELIQHTVKSDDGEWEEGVVLESKDIEVPAEGGRVVATFEHTVEQPAEYAYSARIAETQGESSYKDNQSPPKEITVTDEKVKVLLISGAPNWDYRMLRRLLQRDTNIILSCWLQSMDQDRPQDGNAPISQFPSSFAELKEYNVVMMIDPDTRDFDEPLLDNLKKFVKKSGGLFFMAGPKHTNMFVRMNSLSGIRDMLPVRFGDDEAIEIGQILASTTNTRPGKMLFVNHNLGHPVMSFVSDYEENMRLWNLMPSIYWSFPTLTAKPTALTLMERGDQINVEGNQPLLVAGRYGGGNVVYMGFMGSWRWRRVGLRAQYFDRFWIQVVNYLVETRSEQGKSRGIIETAKNEFELGEKITITGRLFDERFEDLKLETVPAQIFTEEGELVRTIDLKLLPDQFGQYEATFPPQNTGSFKVKVNLEGTDDDTKIEPISYDVKPPSVESRAYWLDEKRLRDIAEASGGKYFTLDEVKNISEFVPQLETTSTYSSPPKPLWDINDKIRYLAFLLPFLLLTIEWAVRKKYRLM